MSKVVYGFAFKLNEMTLYLQVQRSVHDRTTQTQNKNYQRTNFSRVRKDLSLFPFLLAFLEGGVEIVYGCFFFFVGGGTVRWRGFFFLQLFLLFPCFISSFCFVFFFGRGSWELRSFCFFVVFC